MRLPILLGMVGVAFLGFAGISLFDGGKARDVVESFVAGALMLGCAYILGRRHLPGKMRPLTRIELAERRLRK